MNRYLVFILSAFVALVITACSSGNNNSTTTTNSTTAGSEAAESEKTADNGKVSPAYAIKEVALGNPLDQAMITEGKEISEMKCLSCHKLTEERIVGPGWKNITTRREPTWIMNMITNVDMMLAEDAEAQKLLEECLVRMPNQNIKVSEARSILEFMRHNDGEE